MRLHTLFNDELLGVMTHGCDTIPGSPHVHFERIIKQEFTWTFIYIGIFYAQFSLTLE